MTKRAINIYLAVASTFTVVTLILMRLGVLNEIYMLYVALGSYAVYHVTKPDFFQKPWTTLEIKYTLFIILGIIAAYFTSPSLLSIIQN